MRTASSGECGRIELKLYLNSLYLNFCSQQSNFRLPSSNVAVWEQEIVHRMLRFSATLSSLLEPHSRGAGGELNSVISPRGITSHCQSMAFFSIFYSAGDRKLTEHGRTYVEGKVF